MINLNKVEKTFLQGKNEVRVLKELSLKVDKGETVAILGPSGSGKSTLLNLISGIETPTEGNIEFDGQAFDTLTQKERDRIRFERFGFVFSNLIYCHI